MSDIVHIHTLTRTRRSSEWPWFIRNAGVERKRRWRDVDLPDEDVQLRIHTSNWRLVGELNRDEDPEDQVWVKRQRMFAWITRNGETIGAVELVRYNSAIFISTDWFLHIMDMDSGYESELAATCVDAWGDVAEGFLDFGPLVELRNIWLEPSLRDPPSVETLVKTAAAPWLADHSIVLIKAFPLEYDAEQGKFPGSDVAFRRRRRTLVRYAMSHGFRPLPGKDGAIGWMYMKSKRVEHLISDPKGGQL